MRRLLAQGDDCSLRVQGSADEENCWHFGIVAAAEPVAGGEVVVQCFDGVARKSTQGSRLLEWLPKIRPAGQWGG